MPASWLLGLIVAYAAVLGAGFAISAARVVRAGGQPFPFLRARTHLPHGYVERCMVVLALVAAAYVGLRAVGSPAITALPALARPAWADAAVAALLVGSAALVEAGLFSMGPAWRIGVDAAPRALVARGPFRWIRHPIYAGIRLGALAAALIAPDLVVLPWVAVAWVLTGVQARLEEEFLSANLPGYAEYAARAGRFWPRRG